MIRGRRLRSALDRRCLRLTRLGELDAHAFDGLLCRPRFVQSCVLHGDGCRINAGGDHRNANDAFQRRVVKYVILTHADIDHIGNAAELKRISGAKLVIHAEDAPILAGKKGFRGGKSLLGFIMGLIIRLLPFHPVDPDIVLQGDSEIEVLKIIDTSLADYYLRAVFVFMNREK